MVYIFIGHLFINVLENNLIKAQFVVDLTIKMQLIKLSIRNAKISIYDNKSVLKYLA